MGLLDGFLSDKGRGGNAWLGKWKEAGNIVVWLHVQCEPIKVYTHSFIIEDEVEDRESGKKKRILRFPRFVGPDPAEVYEKQNFRNRERGGPERVPDRDPFLILREYLRTSIEEGAISEQDTVFEWTDHKNSALIKWTAGELSGLVKTNKRTWSHDLRAKKEYILVVVDDANPEKGAQVARESSALGDALRREITNQIESDGEEGHPYKHPYAFKWVYDKDADFSNAYRVSRYNRAKLTPEIEKAINADPPDVAQYAEIHDDDMTKIRAAFEAAAQMDLPLDQIFSEDPKVRRAVMRGEILDARARRAPEHERKPAKQAEEETTRTRKKVERTEDAEEEQPARRRKREEPKRIPCDECGHPMLPTDAKCEKCGAEYDVDAAPPPPPKREEPKREETNPKREEKSKPAPKHEDGEKCWQCQSTDIGTDADGSKVCNNCGVNLEDDIPF